MHIDTITSCPMDNPIHVLEGTLTDENGHEYIELDAIFRKPYGHNVKVILNNTIKA